MSDDQQGLSAEELGAQGATALPDKEVVSILDLNADINLAIDAAAPIDLAVAANANVAAPIDAAVGANVLSVDSTAQALSDQGVIINQGLDADASAHAVQDSALDQGNDTGRADRGRGRARHPAATVRLPTSDRRRRGHRPGDAGGCGRRRDRRGRRRHRRRVDGTAGTVGDTAGRRRLRSTERPAASAARWAAPPVPAALLDGNLLNVDVNVDADADLAAPINGAVAANANVAAPIDAAVGANVGSVGSDAVAVSQQDADHQPGHHWRGRRDLRPGIRHHAVRAARPDDGPRQARPTGRDDAPASSRPVARTPAARRTASS